MSKKRLLETDENYHFIEKKIKNIEYNHTDLEKIIILLENINSRLENCEKNISNILYTQNNFIEQQKKKEQHDQEIYRSYIN